MSKILEASGDSGSLGIRMAERLHTRRDFLRSGGALAGLSLPGFFQLISQAAISGPRAKSCIVIYTWGGMSHLESFDPKPEAPQETRGEFGTIPTATPGIRFCEHLPMLAKHSDKLAIVRSVHHRHGGHQQGMYISLTGHDPPPGMKAKLRTNWPSITSMLAHFHDPLTGTPGAIKMPYPMYDNGKLMAGDDGGWLGPDSDPILMRTPAGTPYQGVTRYTEPLSENSARGTGQRQANQHATNRCTGLQSLAPEDRAGADLR